MPLEYKTTEICYIFSQNLLTKKNHRNRLLPKKKHSVYRYIHGGIAFVFILLYILVSNKI